VLHFELNPGYVATSATGDGSHWQQQQQQQQEGRDRQQGRHSSSSSGRSPGEDGEESELLDAWQQLSYFLKGECAGKLAIWMAALVGSF
jgi:hypothetical protein